MAGRQSAAGLHESGVSLRNGHRHPRSDDGPPAPGFEDGVLARHQVGTGIAGAGVGRKAELGIDPSDRNDDRHRGDSTIARMLAWLDLEMTGLDVNTDLVVEIATLVTDDDLNIVAEGPDLVIHAPEEALAAMQPIVVEMHTSSGLLDLIRVSTTTVEEAAAATLEFLKEHSPQPKKLPLCGNSIGTDRRFLDRWMPEVEEHLHYRCIDVSTIKELARRWHPRAYKHAPEKAKGHRALDDIRESVAELRWYREQVFRPPGETAESAAKAATAEAASVSEIEAPGPA